MQPPEMFGSGFKSRHKQGGAVEEAAKVIGIRIRMHHQQWHNLSSSPDETAFRGHRQPRHFKCLAQLISPVRLIAGFRSPSRPVSWIWRDSVFIQNLREGGE